MLTLIRHELLSYYTSLATWVLFAAHQFVLAWLLLSQLETYQEIQPQLAAAADAPGVMDLVAIPTLSTALLLQLVVVPLLGMRAVAAELESGRIALLLSAPIGPVRLAVGKWLGLLLAALPLNVLTVASVASLALGTTLDTGRLFAAALALCTLTALASATTVLFSTLTRQPGAAAVASAGTLFLLWVLGTPGSESGPADLVALSSHLEAFLGGLVRSQDIAYFGLLIAAAVVLTAQRLAALGGR